MGLPAAPSTGREKTSISARVKNGEFVLTGRAAEPEILQHASDLLEGGERRISMQDYSCSMEP